MSSDLEAAGILLTVVSVSWALASWLLQASMGREAHRGRARFLAVAWWLGTGALLGLVTAVTASLWSWGFPTLVRASAALALLFTAAILAYYGLLVVALLRKQ